MDYQLAKFQFCKISLASFMDKFRKKHNDDVIITSFHVLAV